MTVIVDHETIAWDLIRRRNEVEEFNHAKKAGKMRTSISSTVKTAIALTLALTLANLSFANGVGDKALAGISIDNFGQVNENYYRGSQPKGRDYSDLAALGIKTVIDLEYEGEESEQRSVERAGMKFFRIGMSPSRKPDQQQIDEFFRIVNDPANLPVYVHCRGGRHRTGLMTALYRVSKEGWTAEQAVVEMKKYQFDRGFGHGALKSCVYAYPELMNKNKKAMSADSNAR